MRAKLARWAGLVLVLAALAGGAIGFLAGRPAERARSAVELRATPGVVLAIHDVAKLETTSFHIEKVVEASDAQSRLWGFVQAKDALLLVAVGDVVAGVDLTKVRDEDVKIGEGGRSVRVRLPQPEILGAALDERATHVYSRATDVLAERNEQLEGAARRGAEEQMRKAALDGGILERAKTSADRTLRALLHSLGYAEVDLDWADRG
jgi:hypothetical protein